MMNETPDKNILQDVVSMKKSCTITECTIISILLSVITNSYLIIADNLKMLFFVIPLFLLINIFAGMISIRTKSRRLKRCYKGVVLLTACVCSSCVSIIFHIVMAIRMIPRDYKVVIWSALFCIGFEIILFWNGIIRVYLSSTQLGINIRILGAVCGMIPIANLIMLNKIIRTVFGEVYVETQKEIINEARKHEKICATRYPILMVHGVFFRDFKYFNYWGRIPKELEENGAIIYYGNHQSASSIEDSAAELTDRIKEIVKETGYEKVNIIAHSKGGLDCRYAISKLDAAPYVASLITINTPHRGCMFADYLLSKIGSSLKNKVALMYNQALRKFGDENPDFLVAVNDLKESVCSKLDAEMITPPEIYCRSVGSILNKAKNGKFPLNFSYNLVKHFDGPNDGLVGEQSFRWGEDYILVTTKSKRGISHGDMIDLNRENFEGFDVREFFVELVADLKNKGL